ncbi:MAG: cation transporting ATPase C-terminal domain-containing protein, partial [Clostridia bacterium]|nr:cation transporting ATPase C-terminal domain-containing protein [Clostridia bacterium]
LRENRVFLLIMGAVLFIQILFVYLGGSVLRTAPLTASELLVTFSFSLAVLPFDFLRKVIRKRFYPRGGY